MPGEESGAILAVHLGVRYLGLVGDLWAVGAVSRADAGRGVGVLVDVAGVARQADLTLGARHIRPVAGEGKLLLGQAAGRVRRRRRGHGACGLVDGCDDSGADVLGLDRCRAELVLVVSADVARHAGVGLGTRHVRPEGEVGVAAGGDESVEGVGSPAGGGLGGAVALAREFLVGGEGKGTEGVDEGLEVVYVVGSAGKEDGGVGGARVEPGHGGLDGLLDFLEAEGKEDVFGDLVVGQLLVVIPGDHEV